jgi:hypothetical protein
MSLWDTFGACLGRHWHMLGITFGLRRVMCGVTLEHAWVVLGAGLGSPRALFDTRVALDFDVSSCGGQFLISRQLRSVKGDFLGYNGESMSTHGPHGCTPPEDMITKPQSRVWVTSSDIHGNP